MAMLEHNIASTLVLAEDVMFPLDYYIGILRKNFHAEVDAYLDRFDLARAKKFLQRQGW